MGIAAIPFLVSCCRCQLLLRAAGAVVFSGVHVCRLTWNSRLLAAVLTIMATMALVLAALSQNPILPLPFQSSQVGPVIGPLLGGGLAQALGWRSCFAALAIAGGAVLAAQLLVIRETHHYYAARRIGRVEGEEAAAAIQEEVHPPHFDAPHRPLVCVVMGWLELWVGPFFGLVCLLAQGPASGPPTPPHHSQHQPPTPTPTPTGTCLTGTSCPMR